MDKRFFSAEIKLNFFTQDKRSFLSSCRSKSETTLYLRSVKMIINPFLPEVLRLSGGARSVLWAPLEVNECRYDFKWKYIFSFRYGNIAILAICDLISLFIRIKRYIGFLPDFTSTRVVKLLFNM